MRIWVVQRRCAVIRQTSLSVPPLGFSFTDFLTNTGLIAIISLIFVVIYFYFVFGKELRRDAAKNSNANQNYPDPSEAITDKKGFIISTIIFLCAVCLLVTHAQTGLTVSCIGTVIAIVTLIAAGKEGPGLLKKIDYKTLLFFIGLFVVVGGLEQTGVLIVMANFIGSVSDGNAMLMLAIIVLVSAVASAFVDNIPFAATMIPIISSLSETQGVVLSILAWGSCNGYGYRRKCDSDWCICERSWYCNCGKRRLYY